MAIGAIARPAAFTAACVLVACGGGTVNKGGDPTTGTPGNSDDSGVASGDDGGTSVQPDDAATSPPSPSKGEGGVPKVIGSPCAVGTDCASGTCNTSVPNGECTLACAMDSDCKEKGNSTGAVCYQSSCVELCKQTDAGAPVVDGGKPIAPCKNKALVCEMVPGETAPLCMFEGDAGSTTNDAGTPDDDAGSSVDASGASDASGE